MLWKNSYKTGVPLMDSQHQELFRQLDILSDREQVDRVPQVLDFLGKYVDKHFKDEERLQLSCNYPDRMQHKKMHSDFIETYKQLSEDFSQKQGQQGLMILRINRIAVDWLKKHILGPDTTFAKYYLEKNGSQSLASGESNISGNSITSDRVPPAPVKGRKKFSAGETSASHKGPKASAKALTREERDTTIRTASAKRPAQEKQYIERTSPAKSVTREERDARTAPAKALIQEERDTTVHTVPTRGLTQEEQDVLRRVPAESLAEELVKRSNSGGETS